jgi:hypothetical protein
MKDTTILLADIPDVWAPMNAALEAFEAVKRYFNEMVPRWYRGPDMTQASIEQRRKMRQQITQAVDLVDEVGDRLAVFRTVWRFKDDELEDELTEDDLARILRRWTPEEMDVLRRFLGVASKQAGMDFTQFRALMLALQELVDSA